MQKSLSAHLADDWPFTKRLESRLSELKMKRSPYLLWLVERDLTTGGQPDPMAPTILVDLTRDLLGKLDAEDMQRACDGVDQRKELRGLLSHYLADRSEKPRSHKRV